MKIIKFMSLLLGSLIQINVYGFTDQDFVIGLENLEEWEAAYQYGSSVAAKTQNYNLWKYLASKQEYREMEVKQHDKAYWQAWHLAYQQNTIKSYKDFISIRPNEPTNLLAVHTIFELIKQQNTPQAYLMFLDDFPTTIYALNALLQLQTLAFEEAEQKNTKDSYQFFITSFPQAPQIENAINLFKDLEKKEIEEKLTVFKTTAELDDFTRELYNNAREMEKISETKLIALSHYHILCNTPAFKKTKVVTEIYDREERLAFESFMRYKLEEINQNQKDLVDAINKQGMIIKGGLDNLTAITQQHHETMKIQLQKINHSIEKHGTIVEVISVVNTLANVADLWVSPTTLQNITFKEGITTAHVPKKSSGVCYIISTGIGFVNPIAGKIGRMVCGVLPLAENYFNRSKK